MQSSMNALRAIASSGFVLKDNLTFSGGKNESQKAGW